MMSAQWCSNVLRMVAPHMWLCRNLIDQVDSEALERVAQVTETNGAYKIELRAGRTSTSWSWLYCPSFRSKARESRYLGRYDRFIQAQTMITEHFDVLIMGAGLSGIDAAYHLQKLCPNKTYVILEQRERIGGTWDLFRYPGIRSDSDMLTMGYSFRPWTNVKAISPGEDIREYIAATARDEGIDRHIRFRHEIKRASWCSQEAKWTVEAIRISTDGSDEAVTLTCNFLFSCAGYYRYSEGYAPEFPGIGRFKGRWFTRKPGLRIWTTRKTRSDHRQRRNGRDAVASLAKTASHVTMLQRSPTYIVSLPAHDATANRLRRVLPAMWAYRLTRWKNVAFMLYLYQLAQRLPTT